MVDRIGLLLIERVVASPAPNFSNRVEQRMALPFRHCSSSRLDEIVNHGLLCAFDFDGTLAPLPAQSEKVRVPLGTVLRLFELSTYTPVAVITRRSPAEIYASLEFEPDFVVDGGSPEEAVLSRLLQERGVRSLIYIGNDISDEDMLQCRGRTLLSIRVGHTCRSAGEFFLPHRLDVFQLLDQLIGRLRGARTRNWIRRGFAGDAPRPLSVSMTSKDT
jgi:hypothetical protein